MYMWPSVALANEKWWLAQGRWRMPWVRDDAREPGITLLGALLGQISAWDPEKNARKHAPDHQECYKHLHPKVARRLDYT